jgi:hypothetical protein
VVDNYTLFLAKNTGQNLNITSLTGNLAWRDSVDSLGMELTFDVGRNAEDIYLAFYDLIELGDKVMLFNNNTEVFRGIITDLTTERYKKSITAFDYAFYLNQSKAVIQFYNVSVTTAVKQLCDTFSVPIGSIADISTLITKIYKDKTIAEIIKDMLEQATDELDIKYRLEMRAGELYIAKYTDLTVTATFQPAPNVAAFNVTNAIGSVTKKESIQTMRNSIQITSSDEQSSRIIATATDDNSIATYGLLQDVESVNDADTSQAANIASNKLAELNKVQQDISLTLLGDDVVRSARLIAITNDLFGLNGNYLVKSCTHTYKNLIHKMSLVVEEIA